MSPTSWIVNRLPSWGMSLLKSIGGALWGWYRNLSLVPMFIVTCIAGAIVFVAIGRLSMPASDYAQLRRLFVSLLVLALLVVLIVGMFRRGRR